MSANITNPETLSHGERLEEEATLRRAVVSPHFRKIPKVKNLCEVTGGKSFTQTSKVTLDQKV